jgi:uncharacterized protein YndB with AHSA1/START domain
MAALGARNSDTFQVSTPSERTIVLTRVFDAPRHLVFEAMTRPEHIRRWWGQLGDGYSVPVCEVDLRVGGAWRFVNQHPKGQAEFYGVYREIAPPGRVVFTEIFAPFPDAESVVSAVLTEENGKTRLTATCTYPSKDVRDMVIQTGMEKGAARSYDRLEEVAQELASLATRSTRDTE